MNQPTFRNPDLFEVRPEREFIRQNMPTGKQGFIVEDLDLVLRYYSTAFDQDDDGCFALVEIKYGNTGLSTSKVKTFGLIHHLLRELDQERRRYLGFWKINTDTPEWQECNEFRVNGHTLDQDQFVNWLLNPRSIKSLFDERPKFIW